jgi:hypothetical protein
MTIYNQYKEEIRLFIIEEKTAKSKEKLIVKLIKRKWKVDIPRSTVYNIYQKYLREKYYHKKKIYWASILYF